MQKFHLAVLFFRFLALRMLYTSLGNEKAALPDKIFSMSLGSKNKAVSAACVNRILFYDGHLRRLFPAWKTKSYKAKQSSMTFCTIQTHLRITMSSIKQKRVYMRFCLHIAISFLI